MLQAAVACVLLTLVRSPTEANETVASESRASKSAFRSGPRQFVSMTVGGGGSSACCSASNVCHSSAGGGGGPLIAGSGTYGAGSPRNRLSSRACVSSRARSSSSGSASIGVIRARPARGEEERGER
eukprot:scaffold60969_cov26-Tisochrysis_lutea.AAC.1